MRIDKHRHSAQQMRSLRRSAAERGIALGLVLEKLAAQRDRCPICSCELPIHVRIDLDDDGDLRGLLCKPCESFVKLVDADPLRAKKPARRPYRKANALRYLRGH